VATLWVWVGKNEARGVGACAGGVDEVFNALRLADPVPLDAQAAKGADNLCVFAAMHME
jgi:hypothetical protein